jgi:hypothetical protein
MDVSTSWQTLDVSFLYHRQEVYQTDMTGVLLETELAYPS